MKILGVFCLLGLVLAAEGTSLEARAGSLSVIRCASRQSCRTCVDAASCGWCSSDNRCMPGTTDMPVATMKTKCHQKPSHWHFQGCPLSAVRPTPKRLAFRKSFTAAKNYKLTVANMQPELQALSYNQDRNAPPAPHKPNPAAANVNQTATPKPTAPPTAKPTVCKKDPKTGKCVVMSPLAMEEQKARLKSQQLQQKALDAARAAREASERALRAQRSDEMLRQKLVNETMANQSATPQQTAYAQAELNYKLKQQEAKNLQAQLDKAKKEAEKDKQQMEHAKKGAAPMKKKKKKKAKGLFGLFG